MKRIPLGVPFVLGIAVLLMAGGTVLAQGASGRGHLVLNGGGAKPQVVLELFVRLAGGADAPIIILPTASGEADTGSYYETLFREKTACTQARALELHKRIHAYRKDFVKAIDQAGGLWFSGGDQNNIVAALAATPVGRAVERLFERGGVIGGTSAGTACQSDPMITGEGMFSVIQKDSVSLAPGLGFIPGVIIDQHFLARRRQNRLLSALFQHPEYLGVGVDEATALWLKPNLCFEVVGDSQIMVFDARHAKIRQTVNEEGEVKYSVSDLRTHVLAAGDRFDLRRRMVLPPPPASQAEATK